MKTAIKKILIGVMCGVMILSGTSCLFIGPSAREQAKYKEQRKQELDKIPIEDSRYKIVSLEEGEELPEGMVKEYPFLWSFYSNDVNVNGCVYSYKLDTNEDEEDRGEYTFTISRDGGEEKTVMLDYRDEFKNYYKVGIICFYDGLIFLVRGGVESTGRWSYRMQEILPYILFVYNYETNELKYAGYGEDWMESGRPPRQYIKKEQTIKHREGNENK